jgi:succinyl-CoA synthetase beta subunit
MIIAEDSAKKLLANYGLPVPRGRAVTSADEASQVARELGGKGVVKALIPISGRGKAGGVRVCDTPQHIYQAASDLLGKELLGHLVQTILVEELMPVSREIYAGVVANSATDRIDLIVSLAGGIEIENAARKDASSLRQMSVNPGDVLPVHRVRRWLQQDKTGLAELPHLPEILVQLYRAAADLDAMLLEINPLALLTDGRIVLLDCKLEVDNNALVRQPELIELYLVSLSPREMRARELGVSYVPLDGDIGVITSGAGLGMATLDMLKNKGLSPANFLDTGGGISEQMVQGALQLIMEPPRVRGAIINLYGGINRMLEAAKGVRAALENIRGARPVVVKVLGNQQEEAWAMLETLPNVHVIRVVQTEAAVERLAQLLS